MLQFDNELTEQILSNPLAAIHFTTHKEENVVRIATRVHQDVPTDSDIQFYSEGPWETACLKYASFCYSFYDLIYTSLEPTT